KGISGNRISSPKGTLVLMRSGPEGTASWVVPASMSSSSASRHLLRWKKDSPAGVSDSLRVERFNSVTRKRASSLATALETAEGLMQKWRAAREKLPVSIVATNSSISTSLLPLGADDI